MNKLDLNSNNIWRLIIMLWYLILIDLENFIEDVKSLGGNQYLLWIFFKKISHLYIDINRIILIFLYSSERYSWFHFLLLYFLFILKITMIWMNLSLKHIPLASHIFFLENDQKYDAKINTAIFYLSIYVATVNENVVCIFLLIEWFIQFSKWNPNV